MAVIALAIIALAGYGLTRVPTGFMPIEDQGYLLAERAAARRRLARAHPEGARPGLRDRAQDAGGRAGRHHRRHLGARQQLDTGQCRRRLHHAQGLERARQRRGPALAVLGLNSALGAIEEARILVLPPPPIQGIGNAAGFTMQLELRDGSFDLAKLQARARCVRRQRLDAVEPPARAGLVPRQRAAIHGRRSTG